MKETRRWSVEKRLEFIDFCLYWEGQINRSDIMNQFKISVPQASKDLSYYQEKAPENLIYNPREKKYLAAKTFKPVFFNPDVDVYLNLLQESLKVGANLDDVWLSFLPEHDFVRLPHRNISPIILKAVVQCIKEKKALEVYYQSMSSEDPSWRQISPHAFAFDGHRWHARSYCHRSNCYKDFLLSRIQKVREAKGDAVSGSGDKAWHETFTISLKPHPKLSKSQADAIAQDYNMRNGRLDVTVRLALLYYFLRRMGLEDCDGSSKDKREQHVVVANKVETQKANERA